MIQKLIFQNKKVDLEIIPCMLSLKNKIKNQDCSCETSGVYMRGAEKAAGLQRKGSIKAAQGEAVTRGVTIAHPVWGVYPFLHKIQKPCGRRCIQAA